MATKKELRAALDEMIEVMPLTETNAKGKKVPLYVDNNASEDELLELLRDAVNLIEPPDKFSEKTSLVINEISDGKIKVPSKKMEVEEPVIEEEKEIPVPTLLEEIESAEKIKELKNIALSEPQFKAIRGKLSGFTDIDKLREEMVWLYTGAKVPDKPATEQELPIEETQQEVAERIHKKLEEKSVKTEPPDIPNEKLGIPNDSYPEGKLMMRCKSIKTRTPFNALFDVDDKLVDVLVESMKKNGYDSAFPIILWNDVVVDGHQRLDAAEAAGLKEVPVYQKEFADETEALEYAIHNQRDRRNLSEAELLKCIEAIDKPVTKQEAGRMGTPSKDALNLAKTETSRKSTAKTLKIGENKVQEARTVLKDEKAKKEVLSGKKTIHAAAKEVEKKKVVKPKVEVVKKKKLPRTKKEFKLFLVDFFNTFEFEGEIDINEFLKDYED